MILLLVCALANAAEWRELYTNGARATSFLRSSWNRYEENYHPSYAFDGDPVTGWVEGADGDGLGEAIEWPISALRSGSQLKLQVRSGYHKSQALFAANAAPKEVRVSVLDSRGEPVATQNATLARKMDWQEILVPLPGDKAFNAVRLEILSVHPGTKYKDTVISDIRTHVLSDVPANPALEEARRSELLAWKKERLETAAYFARAPATYPWASQRWDASHEEASYAAFESTFTRYRAARDELATTTTQHRIDVRVKVPLPDGVWLDADVQPLLRADDFALFEASSTTGRTVREEEEYGDGVKEVVYERKTSNARVAWTDATRAKPRRIEFSYTQDSWSREASQATGDVLLEYNDAGQLVSVYESQLALEEPGCRYRRESLTLLTWSADGKVRGLEELERAKPESCDDPDILKEIQPWASRIRWSPE